MTVLMSRSMLHFLVVCETGNLTEAALRLGLTQPAVSKSIQKLEVGIDAKLLERGARGLALTPVGLLLRQHAETMRNQCRFFEADVAAIHEGRRGRIRVGVGYAFAATVLPWLMADFVRQFPTIDIEFEIDITDELYPRLVDGKIDVVLASTSGIDPSPEILVKPLSNMEMGVFAREGHPIWKSRLQPADLAAFSWYLFLNDVEGLKALDRWFRAHGLGSPRVALKSTALVTLLELTRHTDGLVYLAASLTAEAVARELRPLPLVPVIWSFPTGVMVRRQAARVKPIQFIIERFLQFNARSLGPLASKEDWKTHIRT
jgi:DNA-binding transcriptional LysR family regulator